MVLIDHYAGSMTSAFYRIIVDLTPLLLAFCKNKCLANRDERIFVAMKN
jgi:hypothetical protein